MILRAPRALITGGGLVGLALVVLSLSAGLSPLDDNSFFTHLATGRLILDEGFPRVDPYLFTPRAGEWIVQSWLASVLYAGVQRVAGDGGLLVLHACLTTALAGLTVRLARRAEGMLARVAVAGLAVLIGLGAWSERPLLIGLLGLGLTLLAVEEGGIDPRWLVPVWWVWVNSHGSFPLGLVVLGALALGRRLDGAGPVRELRALRWSLAGLGLSVLNPYGPKLLLFPLQLLSRNESLRLVNEWQAPSFEPTWQKLFLGFLALTILALVLRPSYRLAIPAVVFVPLALYSTRNIAVATLVLVPLVAAALSQAGSVRATARTSGLVAGVALVVLGLTATMLVARAAHRPPFSFETYPVAALDHLEARGLLDPSTRLLAPDYVGNYLELRYGARADVFIDDRVEVLAPEVLMDYRALQAGDPRWRTILDRYGIDVALWGEGTALAALLQESRDWDVRFRGDGWIVAVRAAGAGTDG